MILADVVGTVVCTEKHPAFHAEKLLAVQPVDDKGRPNGNTLLAIDRASAGVGDRVLLLREGSGIRQIVGRDRGLNVAEAVTEAVPIRTLVIGIVDAIDVVSRAKSKKSTKSDRKPGASEAAE